MIPIPRPKSARLLLTVLVALAACDSSGVDGPNGPAEDEIVDGVNLTRLFARALAAEISAVRAEWAARDADRAQRYSYVTLPPIAGSDGSELIVYEARPAGGGEIIHHGVVRRPPRPPGDIERRPVVLVLPAHGDVVTVEGALAAVPLTQAIRDDVVFVVVAHRGQTLRVEGIDFASAADASAAYDLDADDAMAMLDAVLAGEILADAGRLALAGYDRGATAALIISERYEGLDLVISLAAPTDFLLPSMRQLTRSYLLGQGTFGFPAFDLVASDAIDPLRGGAGDLAAARLELIRRSPAYFVGPPPFVFAAHGTLDGAVSVTHGRALAGLQGTPDSVYLELEEHDHGSILTSQEVMNAASGLFLERVAAP